ncbi:MAG: hypothetical protein QOI55_2488, partial [Actinomycetota bacterium]|nr:hypothetical protein [Actinomycetota bacterium]
HDTANHVVINKLSYKVHALEKGLTLRSSVFTDGQPIPKAYTCDGGNTSPPLDWTGVPDKTAQLALIVDDADAPGGTFVHWVIWGLAPDAALESGRGRAGATVGKNGAGQQGYAGPCPPNGAHHYQFQLFALSAAPRVGPGADAQTLRDAIKGITITSTTLTGTYQRG